jgi:hypothetical protein
MPNGKGMLRATNPAIDKVTFFVYNIALVLNGVETGNSKLKMIRRQKE